MNKIVKLISLIFLSGVFFITPVCSAKEDFEEIYESLVPANFEYIFGIDPFQAEEYKKYMFSPYPLLRIGVNFIFKDIVIPPGFYLLTPRERDGKMYILFKENGKVKYMIPTYDIKLVSEEFYDQYIPKPKQTKWKAFKVKAADVIGRAFPEKTQRMPAPKSFMEINDIDGEFYQVILYYGDKKYYLVFKQDN